MTHVGTSTPPKKSSPGMDDDGLGECIHWGKDPHSFLPLDVIRSTKENGKPLDAIVTTGDGGWWWEISSGVLRRARRWVIFLGPSSPPTLHVVDPYIFEKKMSSSLEPDVEVDMALAVVTHHSTSLEDLLHTNSPPSEREASRRETKLLDAYDALKKLDQEIEQIEIALSVLKRRRYEKRTMGSQLSQQPVAWQSLSGAPQLWSSFSVKTFSGLYGHGTWLRTSTIAFGTKNVSSFCGINWHRFVKIPRKEPPFVFCSDFFRNCKSLQEFTIPTFEGIPGFDADNIVHIFMNCLVVKNRLLPYLTFPSLHALSLDRNDCTGPEAISDVCDLISQSGCSLAELCLNGFSPKLVIELLEQCPNLRQLSFSYRPGEWGRHTVDVEFMCLLGTQTDGHQWFLGNPDTLPRLQSLSISVDNEAAIAMCCINNTFMEGLKSRWRPGENSHSPGPLRSFELSATAPICFDPMDVAIPLKQLKEEGMAISITTRYVGVTTSS
ncbi:hypothetical protein IW261DRAFT_1422920 [Armillaria novae-zelandiae]|uniref:F-box domain-containing protein n=1 Tax=Armillaria novae-zelandiae TaxID=153914 RepID=A0AA39NZ90_9AGAR|nr:hypothetical protein IW261DRAFT_1422920 [Armillaria novae-zelandiae]